jgi:hypothetical protein
VRASDEWTQSWASRVGHLAVVFFGQDTGFDDVTERAGLFQLGSAFLQRTGLPERTRALYCLKILDWSDQRVKSTKNEPNEKIAMMATVD